MIGQLHDIASESVSGSRDLSPYGRLGWKTASEPIKTASDFSSRGEPEYVKSGSSWTSLFNIDLLNQDEETIPINASSFLMADVPKFILDSAMRYTTDWATDWQSSSTSVSNEDSRIALEAVFGLAAGENFEDGIETEFSRRLEVFIKYHGKIGISLLQSAMSEERFREQYIAEALLWIGDIEHENTKDARRLLLERALDSESVFIRDAAVSGLSYLGDLKSIRRLSKAQEGESSQAVRINIEAVLRYLHKLAS